MATTAEVQRRAARVLEAAARDILEQVRRVLAQIAEGDERLSMKRHASEVRELVAQLRRIARQRGAGGVLELLAREIPEQVEDALRAAGVADLGGFAPRLADTLERLFVEQERQIVAVFDAAADEMAAALRRALVTGQDLDAAIGAVAHKLDTTFGRAAAAVDTAVAGFSRAATFEAVAALEEQGAEFGFTYLGPEDGKNRPFCERHVGRWYTAAEIAAMQPDPGQPSPVSVFAGGYNCRHEWVPTLRSEAIEEGIPIGGSN